MSIQAQFPDHQPSGSQLRYFPSDRAQSENVNRRSRKFFVNNVVSEIPNGMCRRKMVLADAPTCGDAVHQRSHVRTCGSNSGRPVIPQNGLEFRKKPRSERNFQVIRAAAKLDLRHSASVCSLKEIHVVVRRAKRLGQGKASGVQFATYPTENIERLRPRHLSLEDRGRAAQKCPGSSRHATAHSNRSKSAIHPPRQ